MKKERIQQAALYLCVAASVISLSGCVALPFRLLRLL